MSSNFEYNLPYNGNKLFIKFFKPKNTNFEITTCFLLVHWMDVRGHKGNSIYEKIGEYYSSSIGIPVFLFDIQGSGNSKGVFEFPQKQKDQIKIVYDHILNKLNEEFTITKTWTIIPIVHSISAVALMSAINEGLPIKRLIWIGGPPSHGKSLKREISSRGPFAWYKFRFMAFIDIFSGFFGLPLTIKFFGFKLRLKDIRKSFSKADGAKMMLPHTELDILTIFGSDDQYMRLSDIDEEFPAKFSKHIKRVILPRADHSFENSHEELEKIINEFINK